MATHDGELVKSPMTGNVYCVTEWKALKGAKDSSVRQAKKKYDVTDDFEQLSRAEWEPMYHLLRKTLKGLIAWASECHQQDADLASRLEDVRQELIRFGHPDYQEDLQSPDWFDAVWRWKF